jgi:glycosyltransferase involved in cell wall biosynthesis
MVFMLLFFNMEYKLSILLPTIDETDSLIKTIDIIFQENKKNIHEVIIIISEKKTTSQSIEVIENLKNKFSQIKVLKQKRSMLGGAIRDGFEYCSGTHVVLMASDYETDPSEIKNFISLSLLNPLSIITGNRWIKGGEFKEYNMFKFIFNFFFQRMFSLLFKTNLTDLTFGYRLFPTNIIKKINWEETNHAFLFETIVKPLKLKINVIEIPSSWKKNNESSSNFRLHFYLDYFRIGFKTLVSKSETLLIKNEKNNSYNNNQSSN